MKLEVPFEWKTKKLNQVSKVTIGLVTTMTENYVSSGVPLIRNSDIKENKILKSRLIKLETSFANQYPTRVLLRDDIVTVHTGDVGVSSVIDEELEGCFGFATLNTRVDKSKLYPQFLCWYFNSSAFLAYAVSLSTGDGRRNLNLKDFSKSPVPVPPLLEQIKIASILSTWDNAINKVQKLLANSQQQKKALMQQLLTGKKRFSGFDGEWEEKRLGDISDMNSGGTPKSSVPDFYNGDIPWVSIADMTKQGKFINSTERYITGLGMENSSARLYPKNTILYAMYASIGESSIANVECCSSQAILGIRSKQELYYEFLYFYLCFLKEKIKLQGQQGTQSNLNAGMVKNFKIKLPSLPEQQKIAAVLTTADQEIDNLCAQLNHLKQEKKALMQQLLTGKRRVKIEEAA